MTSRHFFKRPEQTSSMGPSSSSFTSCCNNKLTTMDLILSIAQRFPNETNRERLAQVLAAQQKAWHAIETNGPDELQRSPRPPLWVPLPNDESPSLPHSAKENCSKSSHTPCLSKTDILLSLTKRYPKAEQRERLATVLQNQQQRALFLQNRTNDESSPRPMTIMKNEFSHTQRQQAVQKHDKQSSDTKAPSSISLANDKHNKLCKMDILLSISKHYPNEEQRERLAQILKEQQAASFQNTTNSSTKELSSPRPSPMKKTAMSETNVGFSEQNAFVALIAEKQGRRQRPQGSQETFLKKRRAIRFRNPERDGDDDDDSRPPAVPKRGLAI